MNAVSPQVTSALFPFVCVQRICKGWAQAAKTTGTSVLVSGIIGSDPPDMRHFPFFLVLMGTISTFSGMQVCFDTNTEDRNENHTPAI